MFSEESNEKKKYEDLRSLILKQGRQSVSSVNIHLQ